MTNPRLVILGLQKSGKKTLLQGIGRYLEFDHSKAPEHKIETADCVFNCYAADVFTKYYKAPIDICIASGDNSTISKESLLQVVDENCQGIVYVCRSFDTKAMDCIKKWDESIKESIDNLEIKLVVFSYSDVQNEAAKNNAEKVRDWCIDNLYEFIPANLRIPSHSWKESEKEGVARVVENMECIMWSSMDQSEHRTSERVIEETVIMNNSELEQCANCHKSRNVDQIPLYRCSRCRMVSYCSKECQVKDWKTHKNQVIGFDPAAKAKEEEEKRVKEAEKKIAMSLPPVPKTEEEKASERFAELMQECRRTKEMAKNLPDEERKKRAAAVTAKIMRELMIGTEEEIAQIESDLKDSSLYPCLKTNTLQNWLINIHSRSGTHRTAGNLSVGSHRQREDNIYTSSDLETPTIRTFDFFGFLRLN